MVCLNCKFRVQYEINIEKKLIEYEINHQQKE